MTQTLGSHVITKTTEWSKRFPLEDGNPAGPFAVASATVALPVATQTTTVPKHAWNARCQSGFGTELLLTGPRVMPGVVKWKVRSSCPVYVAEWPVTVSVLGATA